MLTLIVLLWMILCDNKRTLSIIIYISFDSVYFNQFWGHWFPVFYGFFFFKIYVGRRHSLNSKSNWHFKKWLITTYHENWPAIFTGLNTRGVLWQGKANVSKCVDTIFLKKKNHRKIGIWYNCCCLCCIIFKFDMAYQRDKHY